MHQKETTDAISGGDEPFWYLPSCGKRDVGISGGPVAKSPSFQSREPRFDSWDGKIYWRRDRLPTPVFLASLVAQLVQNLPAVWETRVGKIPWRREGFSRV